MTHESWMDDNRTRRADGWYEADDWRQYCENEDREPLGMEPLNAPVKMGALTEPLETYYLNRRINDGKQRNYSD